MQLSSAGPFISPHTHTHMDSHSADFLHIHSLKACGDRMNVYVRMGYLIWLYTERNHLINAWKVVSNIGVNAHQSHQNKSLAFYTYFTLLWCILNYGCGFILFSIKVTDAYHGNSTIFDYFCIFSAHLPVIPDRTITSPPLPTVPQSPNHHLPVTRPSFP